MSRPPATNIETTLSEGEAYRLAAERLAVAWARFPPDEAGEDILGWLTDGKTDLDTLISLVEQSADDLARVLELLRAIRAAQSQEDREP